MTAAFARKTLVPRCTFNANNFLPPVGASTLLGRVGKRTMAWLGNSRCDIHLSFGNLTFDANRENLPLEIREGDWIELRVMPYHDGIIRLVGSRRLSPPPIKMGWLPGFLHIIPSETERLRGILGRLEPAVQAAFVVAMADPRHQSRFLTKHAATDHHVFLGGLFTQAVTAARLAFDRAHPDRRERGVSTITALLYDIGKTFELDVSADLHRIGNKLAPHGRSSELLATVAKCVRGIDEQLAADLISQFGISVGANSGRDHVRDDRIRSVVHESVVASWNHPSKSSIGGWPRKEGLNESENSAGLLLVGLRHRSRDPGSQSHRQGAGKGL